MEKNTLVPIALFFSVVWTIKLLVDARVRVLLMRSSSEELLRAMLAGEERSRSRNALRWGLVLVVLAVAFGIIALFDFHGPTPGAIAVLLGATGVGNLAYFAIARRLG